MEKRFDGTALTALIGGGLLFELGYQAYKYIKKELSRIKRLEKQSNANLAKAGVGTKELETVKKCVKKYEKNAFVKSAFCGFINNKNFNRSELYGFDDNKIEVNSTNLIRVREVVDERGRKNIEFLLEIPSYFDPEFGLNLGDYVRCCDRAASHMWERIVITSARPRKKLVGFVGYDKRDENDPTKRITGTKEVTSEFTKKYKRNPESNHDGIYDFIRDYNGMFKDAEALIDSDDEVYIEAPEDLLEFLGLGPDDDVRIFEVFMAYKIPFPEKFWNPKDKQYQGIDVAKTLECLKYLLKEFKVFRKEDEEEANKNKTDLDDIINFDKFDNVMFQSIDNDDNYKLNHYYAVDSDSGEVETLCYKYGI